MLRSMRRLLGGVRYFSRENSRKDLKWFENRDPLTPISFLESAGSVYRDRASIVYGSARFTWAQTLDRCLRLASALVSLHVKPGDVVLRSMRRLLGGVRYFSRENSRKDLKWFEANRDPLTPISFLERAGSVYRDRASIVYGSARFTWAQTLDRCLRLASALVSLHVKPGDVVR